MSINEMRASPVTTVAASQENRSGLSSWTRLAHRWLGIIFTLTVLANFIVRIWQEPPAWITYSPLPPLFLQMFSGLYLFALAILPNSARVRES